MLKQWVAAVGVPQLVVIGALVVLWLLEQILAATKKVTANSITQSIFNALWTWAKWRYPLVAKLGNVASPPAPDKATPNNTPTLSMLLPLLALPALLSVGCTVTARQALKQDEAKAAAAILKIEPYLKDLEDGAIDVGPCGVDAAADVAAALAGAKGWVTTIYNFYSCMREGIKKLRAEIAANHLPTPTIEHLQAVQTINVLAVRAHSTFGPLNAAPAPPAPAP